MYLKCASIANPNKYEVARARTETDTDTLSPSHKSSEQNKNKRNMQRLCSHCCWRLFHHRSSLTAPAISAVTASIHQVDNLVHVRQLISLINKQSSSWQITTRRYATDSDSSRQKVDVGVVNIPFWGRLLIVSGIAGAVMYMLYSANQEKILENENFRYKEFENIKLGGDWTLTDHHGNKRSSTEFRGQWVVMYMGFTHCPDICPEEMEKLADIVQHFDKDPSLPNLQPIFITLDPERDSPSVIRDYLRDFKPSRIVGFTGSEEEIKEVAKKYRAYYGKGERDADNDYIVDHTIIIYLINPNGQFVNYFGHNLTAEQITESIKKHVSKFVELERRNR